MCAIWSTSMQSACLHLCECTRISMCMSHCACVLVQLCVRVLCFRARHAPVTYSGAQINITPPPPFPPPYHLALSQSLSRRHHSPLCEMLKGGGGGVGCLIARSRYENALHHNYRFLLTCAAFIFSSQLGFIACYSLVTVNSY